MLMPNENVKQDYIANLELAHHIFNIMRINIHNKGGGFEFSQSISENIETIMTLINEITEEIRCNNQ